MEAHPTLEYQKIKGDKTYMEAHPTLEYQEIKGDKTYVEAPGKLPSLPSPKSGHVTYTHTVWQYVCYCGSVL